ncbi:unnamed protein product [Moneuplotes crassus]|uniref:Uncharacterized protein n=1 Tax=Euplotes crassus TaxID=5936 RepID=A0AAD1XJ06_EUPCR|nr:unnamed protein product [Moneuplotes crassus]
MRLLSCFLQSSSHILHISFFFLLSSLKVFELDKKNFISGNIDCSSSTLLEHCGQFCVIDFGSMNTFLHVKHHFNFLDLCIFWKESISFKHLNQFLNSSLRLCSKCQGSISCLQSGSKHSIMCLPFMMFCVTLDNKQPRCMQWPHFRLILCFFEV